MCGALDPTGAICGPYGDGVGTRVRVGPWLLYPGEKTKKVRPNCFTLSMKDEEKSKLAFCSLFLVFVPSGSSFFNTVKEPQKSANIVLVHHKCEYQSKLRLLGHMKNLFTPFTSRHPARALKRETLYLPLLVGVLQTTNYQRLYFVIQPTSYRQLGIIVFFLNDVPLFRGVQNCCLVERHNRGKIVRVKSAS